MGSMRLLAAAPNLQKLTVFNLLASTNRIEETHATAPALHSLELIEATLIGDIDIDQINSADSMNAVHIHFDNEDPEDVLHWLQYIAVKYTNISVLSFVCSKSPLGRSSDGFVAAESRILPVLQNLCHLKSFKTGFLATIATLLSTIEIPNSKIEFSLIANYGNTRHPTMIASDYYRLITELVLKIDSSRWFYLLQHMKFIKKLEVHGHYQSHNKLDLNELIKQCPAPME